MAPRRWVLHRGLLVDLAGRMLASGLPSTCSGWTAAVRLQRSVNRASARRPTVAQGRSGDGEPLRYAYREIADRLIKNHVQSILRKLQLNGRFELMRCAIHRGLDRDHTD